MTPATDTLGPPRSGETRLMAGVCFAHLVSHYYIVLLAPLFVFIKNDFGVSYTELSLALTAFAAVSATVQTPVGFFIDRTDARTNLVAGLLIGAGAVAVAALASSYWVFVAMFGLLGLANTVYHPCDYTLLSEHVAPQRLTQAFSYHACSGMMGGAVAPVVLLALYGQIGWRGAFLVSSGLGVIAAVVLLSQRELPQRHAARKAKDDGGSGDGWRLLLSTPILLNLLFFVLLSMVGGGLNQYLVVGLGALHGTPASVANTALTGLLAMSALGVLFGGSVATRSERHYLITAGGMLVTAATTVAIAFVDPGALLLVLVISLGGFASGMAVPSRDMIVRAVTPAGSFGKVFGFLTTGLHLGSVVAPLIFAQFLDHGHPRWVFLFIAVCSLLAILTISFGMSGRRTAA